MTKGALINFRGDEIIMDSMKIKFLIVTICVLLTCAKSASEDSLNEKQIADKVLYRYNEYSMIAGGKLPSIKQYSKTILSRIDSVHLQKNDK
jgi:hypothetical protein